MFWKKKPADAKPTEAKAEVPKPRAKKLSLKDIVRDQIERLGAGQTLTYQLPETFGGGLAVVELNPQYPEKGRKYILSTEELVDGKPAGQRRCLFDSNKPKELAGWILDRYGQLFIEVTMLTPEC